MVQDANQVQMLQGGKWLLAMLVLAQLHYYYYWTAAILLSAALVLGFSQHQYIAFYKPWGMLTSFQSDAERAQRKGRPMRPTLADIHFSNNNNNNDLRYCGRLDRNSEGLLLLTDDGQFTQAVHHNTTHKVYWVQVQQGDEPPSEATLDRMRAGGLQIRGAVTQPPVAVERLGNERKLALLPPTTGNDSQIRRTNSTWLEIILREGRNRQVRRITKAAGHPTLRLVRVAIGELTLFANDELLLAPGAWKYIELSEVLGRSTLVEK